MTRRLLALALLASLGGGAFLAARSAGAPEAEAPAAGESEAEGDTAVDAGAEGGHYDLRYEARIVPTRRVAEVTIRLRDPDHLMRWIRFHVAEGRQFDFRGDGEVERTDEHVRWTPPQGGGLLRYDFRIDRLRDEASYEARCAENWAIFRGDDLVPPARVRTATGAQARATLRLRVPEGWRVAAPYPESARRIWRVEHGHRRFDRPTGWFVAGKLRILRETVAGMRLAIAGPVGQDLRRHDILALLRWTLPSLRDAFGEALPERVLIVGAGDPMWRGGLSAPRSIFLHADRPLISRDLTSPVLHELLHTVMHARSGEGGDWIAEGLAEYYSLQLLRRSGTVSRRRFERALARLEEEGSEVERLDVPEASGAVTARAVGVMHELDAALREATQGEHSLDDVVARIITERGELTPARLTGLLREVAGADLAGAYRGLLDGGARAEATP